MSFYGDVSPCEVYQDLRLRQLCETWCSGLKGEELQQCSALYVDNHAPGIPETGAVLGLIRWWKELVGRNPPELTYKPGVMDFLMIFLVLERSGVIAAFGRGFKRLFDCFMTFVSWFRGPSIREVADIAPQKVEGKMLITPNGEPYVSVLISGREVHVMLPVEGYLSLKKLGDIPRGSLESARSFGRDEMLIPESPIETCKTLPPGVGSIRIGNKVIAMFSRVQVGRQDFLLTAGHAWQAALRMPRAMIEHNGKGCEIDPKWPIMAYSPSKHLDFALVHVPNGIWSGLGVRGLTMGYAGPGALVTVYGYNEMGEMAVSDGRMSGVKRLFFYHTASTRESWSGSPVISAGKVVGIHVKSAPMAGKNVAVYCQPFVLATDETGLPRSRVRQVAYENFDETDWYEYGEVYYPARSRVVGVALRDNEYAIYQRRDEEVESEDLAFLDDPPFSMDLRTSRAWYDEDALGARTSGEVTPRSAVFQRGLEPKGEGPLRLPIFDDFMGLEVTLGPKELSTPVRLEKQSRSVGEEQSSSDSSVKSGSPNTLRKRRKRTTSQQSQKSEGGGGQSEVETPSSSHSSTRTDDIAALQSQVTLLTQQLESFLSTHAPQSQKGLVMQNSKKVARKALKGKGIASGSGQSSNTK